MRILTLYPIIQLLVVVILHHHVPLALSEQAVIQHLRVGKYNMLERHE